MRDLRRIRFAQECFQIERTQFPLRVLRWVCVAMFARTIPVPALSHFDLDRAGKAPHLRHGRSRLPDGMRALITVA